MHIKSSSVPTIELDSLRPTIWGLGPLALHGHFWAAKGVDVVRPGQPDSVSEQAELYLLTDESTLAVFRVRSLVDVFSWTDATAIYVRLTDQRRREYKESAIADRQGRFIRFKRHYRLDDSPSTRIALTRDVEWARAWRLQADGRAAWRALRRGLGRANREHAALKGHVFDGADDADTAMFVRHLVRTWNRPDATIPGVRRVSPTVWSHETASIGGSTRFVGPVWIGAGRATESYGHVLGPTMLWDRLESRPVVDAPRWEDIEPVAAVKRTSYVTARPVDPPRFSGKRLFDVVFASVALLLTLPLYPFVMLAIFLEDGAPFFFVHRRETCGGREFGCIKFRSMRKDADAIRARILERNQSDGPQFFMDSDPRITRTGGFLRRFNLDELPQFINVLRGDMSVVGPRPSPYSENQCSPAWRESRLSVRPGITGLWQVARTRRKGLDFQEWVKFDLEYVQRRGWRLDLRIILMTLKMMLGGRKIET